jgi:HAE1 family hydrophobic/amphiphilic exporter-1
LGSNTRKFGEYTMDDIGNKDTNKSDNVPQDMHIPSPYTEWFSGLVFQWEADLWGKLASRRKAAAAKYLASAEFRRAVSTLVVSEVATTYFELMGLDQEKKVLEENLELQGLGLELIKIQKAGGNVNQLAVDQFEAQLFDTRNRLALVNQKISVTEARINELLGRFPQPIPRDSVTNYSEPAYIQPGRPEELLLRRPDIREAELKLAEAHWDVNAARAAFYPSLNLSAQAGLSSFDASRLFNMPGSVAYSLAGGLTTPIFNRNQIRAQYAAAGSRQKIALANYEKKILESYYDVYRTLAVVNTLKEQIALKNSEVDILHRAFNTSNDLFTVGYATYLEVITAQRRMLEAELELTRLRKDRLKSRAVLYRALGGGWEN